MATVIDASTAAPELPPAGPARTRFVALDALRGLAVAGMVVVNDAGIHDRAPTQLRHADWAGLHLADLVFPMFLFAAGLSLAISRASLAHVVRRSSVLFAVGCVLVSVKHRAPSITSGTLQFIAATLVIAAVVETLVPARFRVPLVLAGFGANVVLFRAGVGAADPGWHRGTNVAAAIDRHVLGDPSELGVVGAVTAALAVVLAVTLGRRVRDVDPATRRRVLATSGTAMLAIGLAAATVVPVVKRLWTPSYLLITFGISALALVGLDLALRRRWAGRLGVLTLLGRTALPVYVGVTLAAATVLRPVRDAVVPRLTDRLSDPLASLTWSIAVLATATLLAWLLGRRDRGRHERSGVEDENVAIAQRDSKASSSLVSTRSAYSGWRSM